jgi:hypothetical protein
MRKNFIRYKLSYIHFCFLFFYQGSTENHFREWTPWLNIAIIIIIKYSFGNVILSNDFNSETLGEAFLNCNLNFHTINTPKKGVKSWSKMRHARSGYS